MRYTDIAIIGGGLAGSTAAAMLGRAGIPTVLIDPHPVYPFDFRVEKISGDEQFGRFYQTGIADSVLRSATHDGETGSPDSAASGVRCLVDGQSRQLPQGHDRERTILACAALGALPGVVRRRLLAADAQRNQRGVKPPGLLLVIVFIVVVGLSGGVVRHMALVVPYATGGEQLRLGAALDPLASEKKAADYAFGSIRPTGCRENDTTIAPVAFACPGGLILKNDIVTRADQTRHQHSGVDAGSPVMILCYIPQNLGRATPDQC
jgi:hypothetical protein